MHHHRFIALGFVLVAIIAAFVLVSRVHVTRATAQRSIRALNPGRGYVTRCGWNLGRYLCISIGRARITDERDVRINHILHPEGGE